MQWGAGVELRRMYQTSSFHFSRNVNHLFERRGDQSGESDDVRMFCDRRLENPLTRGHHAQIDHSTLIIRKTIRIQSESISINKDILSSH